MGVVPSTVSVVLSGKVLPTWEFCYGVAQSFRVPPEDVFRLAGLLPPVANPGIVQALVDVARHLDEDNQTLLRDYGQFLYQRQQEALTQEEKKTN